MDIGRDPIPDIMVDLTVEEHVTTISCMQLVEKYVLEI